jgi:UDP-GlcNAc:undecaprenyl-phosphate/decaprenyl-phosphate GlcNAc-1-phosphate transferase
MDLIPVYLRYPVFLTLLFFFGLVVSFLAVPPVIKLAGKLKATERGGHRRVGKGGIPLLGGLAIAFPVILSLLAFGSVRALIIRGWIPLLRMAFPWLNGNMDYAAGQGEISRDFIVLAVGGIAILLLGIFDDIRGTGVRVKLLIQFGVAVFICLSGYVLRGFYLPLVGTIRLNPDFGVIVSILWIVGLINSFNLIDGLDGLAAGIALIASLVLAALGLLVGNILLVFTCLVLAGSLAAFLRFNFPPARIYLGDTGSMFIGYLLAAVTLMGTFKGNAAVIILGPLLALSFPIFETLVSMIRRLIRGMPIFTGDRYHTHHRLLAKGLSKRRAVLTLYGVSLVLGGAAFLSYVIPYESGWSWLPDFIVGVTLLGIAWWAGYLKEPTLRRIFHRRRRNTILSAFSRYASQSLSSRLATIRPFEILELCRREMRLSFLEAWFEEGKLLIGSSGVPPREQVELQLTVPEELRLTTAGGTRIMLRYCFDHQPYEHEVRDVADCLAQIFEQGGTPVLLAKVIRENQLAEGARESVPYRPVTGS